MSIEISFRGALELTEELNKLSGRDAEEFVLSDDQPSLYLVIEKSKTTGEVHFTIVE